jgi:hypothetical protein
MYPTSPTLNNVSIKQVLCHKHLGLIFRDKMTWSVHHDDNCKRNNKRLDIISKIRYLLPKQCIEKLYNSFVRFPFRLLIMTIALILIGHSICVKIDWSTIFRSWENYLIISISYFSSNIYNIIAR